MNASNKQTIESYNQAVDRYIKASPQIVSDELKIWIDETLAHLDKTAKIREIGSGTGKDATYIASQGYTMELTDASEGFVDYLNQNGHAAWLFDVLLDDLGADYDMIFADAVLLHFTKQELTIVLSKIFEALQVGGRLAFTLKVGDGEESTTRKLDALRYFRYWQQEEIQTLLRKTGFSVIQINSGNDFRGEHRPDWLYINAIR